MLTAKFSADTCLPTSVHTLIRTRYASLRTPPSQQRLGPAMPPPNAQAMTDPACSDGRTAARQVASVMTAAAAGTARATTP